VQPRIDKSIRCTADMWYRGQNQSIAENDMKVSITHPTPALTLVALIGGRRLSAARHLAEVPGHSQRDVEVVRRVLIVLRRVCRQARVEHGRKFGFWGWSAGSSWVYIAHSAIVHLMQSARDVRLQSRDNIDLLEPSPASTCCHAPAKRYKWTPSVRTLQQGENAVANSVTAVRRRRMNAVCLIQDGPRPVT